MRGYIKLFLIIVFVFFLIGILVYLIIDSFNSRIIGVGNLAGDDEESLDDGADELEVSSGLPSGVVSGGGAGGGGSGGGAGSAGAPGEPGCAERQIAYALKNFVQSANCDEFQSDVCIKKTVNCSLEVHNLDDNTDGMFGVRFSFLEEGSVFDYLDKELFVGVNGYEVFDVALVAGSLGESGRANKDLSCSFNSYKIPKEEICS